MSKAAHEQKHELGHRARTHALPDPETDLDARGARTDRRRRTADESERGDDRGRVVILWLLALLIAEIELWMWAFAHMYRP